MKTTVLDVNYISEALKNIGYIICNTKYGDNNGGIYWKITFLNSSAILTFHDNHKQNNSVVGGKVSAEEKKKLENIANKLKFKKINIDPINKIIVNLINNRKEEDYYDYKLKFHENKADLLHDILCLSNNTRNCDAYLIFGVNNKCEVIGLDKELISNDIFDFLKTIKFAGGNIPNLEIKNLYYLHHDIGVIVCKSSKLVPFFLEDSYKDKVKSYTIYTRVGDTNTAKNKSANYKDIEKLWRFHFENEHN